MFAQTEVVAAIQKELGSFFSTEAHGDADIIRYMKSAGNYIANFRDFPFLIKETTVVYTTPLVAATIPYNVKTLGINGDRDATILGKEDWFFPDAREWAFMVAGTEFIANAAGTYTILYVWLPTAPTQNTTTIEFPEDFQQVYTDIAIHYGFKDLKMYDKANALIGAANSDLTMLSQRISNPIPRSGKRLWSKHKI